VSPPAQEPPPPRRPGRRWRLLALLIVLALGIGMAGGWWALQTNLDRLRSQLGDAQRQLIAAQEQLALREREAQLKFERLESELARLRDQRGELDQLYLDLTRGRDESALLEVERLVTLAAQELQISGSVPTALAALQSADARLARIDRPQTVNLRRAIGRDIERLRAAPSIDLTGMAVKIDQISQAVEGWALLSDATPQAAVPAAKARPVAKADAAAAPAAAESQSGWNSLRGWLKQEFGDLVRIREVDTPEALLLTGAQQNLVRQQMRLRLLNARTALLMRNDRLYRADLAEAQALLARYFDVRHSAVATAQAQLKQLAGAALSVDAPQITESLAALRGARQGGR
jgi:uroporphyrinogen III methyltransferase/synthase